MARILGFLLILFFSCKNEPVSSIDISEIEVDFSVDRFEELFYRIQISELPSLKEKYALMFPENIADSIWISRINDEDEQYLFKETQRVFGDFSETKAALEKTFKYIKYYNPKFVAPNVITHISDLDYEYPVIYIDSLLFISLDMYLGKNNIVYSSFPKYISESYDKRNVVVDVVSEVIFQNSKKYKSRIFLDRMINEGRRMFQLDSYLPEVSDELKIRYSLEKLHWAEENEINVWRYFMENELLYSNEKGLNARFIDISPFSKFYQDLDRDSPGQIGVWIGWQIVRSYMKNNDVTLQQLLGKSTEEIFRKSKYKPKK